MDCISVQGNCTVVIPGDITLTNCKRCIYAEGSANLTLGNISCSADGDGINSLGNANVNTASSKVSISAKGNSINTLGTSMVNMNVNGLISISGAKNGISSTGNSVVSLGNVSNVSGITITSIVGNGILAQGTSNINVDSNSVCTISGKQNPFQIKGNATVNTDGCNLAALP